MGTDLATTYAADPSSPDGLLMTFPNPRLPLRVQRQRPPDQLRWSSVGNTSSRANYDASGSLVRFGSAAVNGVGWM